MAIDLAIATILITTYLSAAHLIRHLWNTITADDLNDI